MLWDNVYEVLYILSFEMWTMTHTISLRNNTYENITLDNLFEYNLTGTPVNTLKLPKVKKVIYISSTPVALEVQP